MSFPVEKGGLISQNKDFLRGSYPQKGEVIHIFSGFIHRN
jgi:hypothetical protein